jgi:hypothetical protein
MTVCFLDFNLVSVLVTLDGWLRSGIFLNFKGGIMRKIAIIAMLFTGLAHAGTKVQSSANGVTTLIDDGMSRAALDSAVFTLQAYMKNLLTNSSLVCAPAQVDLKPVLDAIKAQPACDLAPVLAAIKAIPSTGTPPVVTPPVVTPPVTPAGGGIFIGTKEFNSLADAAAGYKPGDTVNIKKSLDNQSGAFVTGSVTIVCDPGVKLTWSAGTNLRPAWGKGFIVAEGTTDSLTVRGCEMSGMVLAGGPGGNAAGIRVSAPVKELIVDGVYIHHSNNGILGGAAHTVIKNSKFEYNGVFTGGTANVHNIYLSAEVDLAEVSDSYFGSVTPANHFKSRAKSTLINHSVFESKSDVPGSYLIDLPNGGLVVVKNSVLVKAPNQPQRFAMSYGVEGILADGRTNTFEFANNIIVSDMPNSTAFLNGTGALNFHDNILVGLFDQVPPMSNAKFFSDRASAGLQPAPALPALPATVMSFKK